MPVSTGYKIYSLIFGIIVGVFPGLIIYFILAWIGLPAGDPLFVVSYIIGVLISAGAFYGKEANRVELIDAVKNNK